MGYYIQTPGHNVGKALRICATNPDALIIPKPASFSEVPEELGLVCVVENGLFDAAGYCYDEKEFLSFGRSDDFRQKTWLLMNKEKAETLSGYRR